MYCNLILRQGPQGLQKLRSLKSRKIQNNPPTPDIFTTAPIRIGFLIKKTVKNVQIDPKTTEIWLKTKRDVVSE